jgi:hypothetical protein
MNVNKKPIVVHTATVLFCRFNLSDLHGSVNEESLGIWYFKVFRLYKKKHVFTYRSYIYEECWAVSKSLLWRQISDEIYGLSPFPYTEPEFVNV